VADQCGPFVGRTAASRAARVAATLALDQPLFQARVAAPPAASMSWNSAQAASHSCTVSASMPPAPGSGGRRTFARFASSIRNELGICARSGVPGAVGQ